jgi:tyrosine-protein kinase Etk/Wzc
MSDRAHDRPPDNLSVPTKELGLLDIAIVLVSDRRRIAIVTFAALLLGAAISFLIKPTFTASALILPPQQQQSSVSAMMGQLGSLIGGGGSGLSLKNPADLYVGILESRTIADHLIAKFNLGSVYKAKRMEDIRTALKNHVTIDAAKDGLIHISVMDQKPQRASDLTNAYIDELYDMNSKLAITEAAQRRQFFDQQLADEKNALAAAESDLKATQERTGLIQVSGQAESIILSIAQLRAEISSREVQMQAMRTFATDQNPDMVRIQQEISKLQEQLSVLQNNQQRLQPGDTQLPAGRLPEDALEYARKFREVKYHESLLELLSRQFEGARIDEAKSAPIIQVVDRAIPPDKKSGPHRMLLTLGVGLFGFCLGCLWVFLRHALAGMRQVSETSAKLDQLRVFRARTS